MIALGGSVIWNNFYSSVSTHVLTTSAETVTTFHIPIENIEKSGIYKPQLYVGKGIYAGDAIVKKEQIRNI